MRATRLRHCTRTGCIYCACEEPLSRHERRSLAMICALCLLLGALFARAYFAEIDTAYQRHLALAGEVQR